MKEFNSSGLAPTSIIAPSAQIKQAVNAVLKEEILDFSSSDEYAHYITHKVNNVKQKNGRIYLKIVDGILHANSVSPYSETFIDNIEEKIKPLVLALKNKRYLTYSSCMGHDFTFRRYVGLAFADEETRQYVSNEINSLKLLGVKTVYFDSVSNSKVTQNEKTKKPIFGKYTEQERLERLNYQEEARIFNIQFHRSYEQYYFMEIIILDAIKMEYEGFYKEIKKLAWKCIKVLFWNYLTKKVVDHINSPTFKKYPY